MRLSLGCRVDEDSPQERRGRQKRQQQHFPAVAETLRALRARHDLTQEEMAPLLGLTFAGYRPYERGERELTHVQIERLATALGVPVSSITGLLWPEDVKLVSNRYAHDLVTLQQQIEGLPPEIGEQILRGFLESVALLHSASDLARRN
jgi:transcriptional regulator with XRE-family HTH domain